jgi:AraC-like DNA-binding protein
MHKSFNIPPGSPFSGIVHSAWQIDQFCHYHIEHIIPKGVVEIIFNFSDSSSMRGHLGNAQYHLPNCFINGYNRSSIRVGLPDHQVFFGVRFHPMAIKKVFGVPASEFSDSVVDLTLIDPDFCSLWHQLVENDFDARISIFLHWMQDRIYDCVPQEKLVNEFLSALDQHDRSVKELSHTLCYSARHLSRKITEATGMNTEEMLLYKKYLHAVHLIHHTDMSLSQITYQSHFSDQSHFIRSFRKLTDMTPNEYRRKKSVVKGHLYENVR